MNVLKKIFRRNDSARVDHPKIKAVSMKRSAAVAQLKPQLISTAILKDLIPIRNLSDEEITAFSLSQKSEVFAQGSILFNHGEAIDSVLYLIDGTVLVESNDESNLEFSAASFKAKFPLSSGRFHNVTVHAKTDVRVLRVPTRILEVGNKNYYEKRLNLEHVLDSNLQSNLKTSALLHTFCNQFCHDKISLPTLPHVAIKLQNALKDDIGIADAVKIIQLDPTITAKLMQVANSPLYMSAEPAGNCLHAVNRLGVTAMRSLVMSISVKQMFRCKNKKIKEYMERFWKQSIYLSSLCYILASKTKKVDPEQALLAGLISDIGIIPFLSFAAEFPSNMFDPKEIDLAIPLLRGPVGVSVLRKWEFPDELIDIPVKAEDWLHKSGDNLSLSDIVMLSKLHSFVGTPKAQKVPYIHTTPAFGKLPNGALTPELSLSILTAANDRIDKVSKVFG